MVHAKLSHTIIYFTSLHAVYALCPLIVYYASSQYRDVAAPMFTSLSVTSLACMFLVFGGSAWKVYDLTFALLTCAYAIKSEFLGLLVHPFSLIPIFVVNVVGIFFFEISSKSQSHRWVREYKVAGAFSDGTRAVISHLIINLPSPYYRLTFDYLTPGEPIKDVSSFNFLVNSLYLWNCVNSFLVTWGNLTDFSKFSVQSFLAIVSTVIPPVYISLLVSTISMLLDINALIKHLLNRSDELPTNQIYEYSSEKVSCRDDHGEPPTEKRMSRSESDQDDQDDQGKDVTVEQDQDSFGDLSRRSTSVSRRTFENCRDSNIVNKCRYVTRSVTSCTGGKEK